jgi:4-amino-4-deoxy-L-arabinose transferase-like glycosyltransferase
LLVAALPVFFVFLDANAIWDANEAFYVETPRQMVASGDYITPTFNDEPRLNKPVLSYWLVAGLYQIFGVFVGVERAGIALGAVGIILATFVIGRSLGSRTTGVVAALIVATAPQFVFWSRRIFIDVYITLFASLALAFFMLAERDPVRRRRWLGFMYVAIGLGVLTKGPVGLVLPALVVGVWLVFERRLADIGRLRLVTGAAIVVAIVAPWYVALFTQLGWDPIAGFFVGENLGRFVDSMAPDRGLFFYVPVLLTHLFPWALLVLVPLVTVAPGRVPRRPDERDPLRRLLWLWVVLIVGLFSFSQTKQALYILPVVPAVAALVADALVRTRWGASSRTLGVTMHVVGVIVVALAVAVFVMFGPSGGVWSLSGVAWCSAALGVGGVALVVCSVAGRPAAGIAALAAGLVLFNYGLVSRVLPDVERFKPAPALAAVIHERADRDALLAHWRMSLPSLVYYAGRPVETLGSSEEVVERLEGDREVWVVVSEPDGQVIRERAALACVALRAWSSTPTLRDVLARAEPPAVVLLTNRCR